jgi:hypothetical protein
MRLNFCPVLGGHARPLIFDLEENAFQIASDLDHSTFAAGMAMNVSQALLDDTKDRQLHVAGKSSEFLGNTRLETVASILEREAEATIQNSLTLVQQDAELNCITLT